jgi:hypothetical protein
VVDGKPKKREEDGMKKLIVLAAALGLGLLGSSGCEFSHKGDRILIVEIADEDVKGKDLSELQVVQKALEVGGKITVNVSIARQVDVNFDQLYTVTGTDGTFLLLPAILNWVGGHGWNLKEAFPLVETWIFVKPR